MYFCLPTVPGPRAMTYRPPFVRAVLITGAAHVQFIFVDDFTNDILIIKRNVYSIPLETVRYLYHIEFNVTHTRGRKLVAWTRQMRFTHKS